MSDSRSSWGLPSFPWLGFALVTVFGCTPTDELPGTFGVPGGESGTDPPSGGGPAGTGGDGPGAGSATRADDGASGDAGGTVGGARDDAATSSSPPGDSGVDLSADCTALVGDPQINWRESSLQTDQEIVECLAHSLGRPIGFGERAVGGFDPDGASTLTVITEDSDVSVEQQIADAVGGDGHTWIVFDKRDFAEPSEIALYRLACGNTEVQAALEGSEAECLDHRLWCDNRGVAAEDCLEVFFNERLNQDLPIRNVPIGSNTTLDGRQSQAFFLFSGFQIGSDSDGAPVDTENSVIVTNVRFQGAGHTEDHELDPDMLRSTGASRDIWIHQNTFDLTGDSAFDVKVGAHDVTVSFNLVRNVKRAVLHGSSDSREINAQITTTMHHNAFITTDDLYDEFGNTARRVPLLRRGASHMFDNVFYNYRKDILSVRVGARIVFENNMFLANPGVSGDDDVDDYVENLLRDVREGSLEVSGSFVWMSDAECNLDPARRGDLTASFGTAPDLASAYSDRSRAAITAFALPAGEALADYVLATAGKGGAVPFNAPDAPALADVMALPHRACR